MLQLELAALHHLESTVRECLSRMVTVPATVLMTDAKTSMRVGQVYKTIMDAERTLLELMAERGSVEARGMLSNMELAERLVDRLMGAPHPVTKMDWRVADEESQAGETTAP